MAKPRNTMSSSERRRLFVNEYLANGFNATQAAIAAGYAASSAAARGSRLLKNPDVAAMLVERMREIAEQAELKSETVVAQLQKMLTADIRALYDGGQLKPPDEWPDGAAMLVTAIERTKSGKSVLRIADRTGLITAAMRYLGLFERDNTQARPVTKVVIVPPKADSPHDGGE